MGTYNSPDRRPRKYEGSFVTALQDFGSSFIGAREVELIDLEKLTLTHLPPLFYIANQNLDRAMEQLRMMNPDLCPPMRAVEKTTEK